MPTAALLPLVVAELEARAGTLGLTPGSFRVEPVLNWGGFVNQSFRIGDHRGRPRFHLKLSAEPGSVAGLERWFRLHRELSERYRAPTALSWITIQGTAHQGILFRHLEGTTLDRWSDDLRRELMVGIGRLHRDRDLRAQLDSSGAPPSCAEGYLADFHQRFTEDLAFVARHPPDFATTAARDWMRDEAERLRRMVTGSTAFAQPAGSPIHGDLWPNNVLVSPRGDWHLLDWDDLRLGDPLLDMAKLLDNGSSADPSPPDPSLIDDAGDQAHRDRLDLYARAILLDSVIDPLADYVDADQFPDRAAEVRAVKRREHLTALTRYRERYPAGGTPPGP
jgi:thiamine kinase-like enzyme